MHQNYKIKKKLSDKERLQFENNFNKLQRIIQRNSSSQKYLETNGSESTQAIDIPEKRERELLQHEFNPHHHYKDLNTHNINTVKIKKKSLLNDREYSDMENINQYSKEMEREDKKKDLFNLINKIDIKDKLFMREKIKTDNEI